MRRISEVQQEKLFRRLSRLFLKKIKNCLRCYSKFYDDFYFFIVFTSFEAFFDAIDLKWEDRLGFLLWFGTGFAVFGNLFQNLQFAYFLKIFTSWIERLYNFSRQDPWIVFALENPGNVQNYHAKPTWASFSYHPHFYENYFFTYIFWFDFFEKRLNIENAVAVGFFFAYKNFNWSCFLKDWNPWKMSHFSLFCS